MSTMVGRRLNVGFWTTIYGPLSIPSRRCRRGGEWLLPGVGESWRHGWQGLGADRRRRVESRQTALGSKITRGAVCQACQLPGENSF